ILNIVGFVKSKSGKRRICIFGGPAILMLFLNGPTFVKGHDALSIQISVTFSNSLKKDREVNTLEVQINIRTIGVTRKMATHDNLIFIINLTIVDRKSVV